MCFFDIKTLIAVVYAPLVEEVKFSLAYNFKKRMTRTPVTVLLAKMRLFAV